MRGVLTKQPALRAVVLDQERVVLVQRDEAKAFA